MGCFYADPQPPTDYGQQISSTLAAQRSNAPSQFSAESQYQPLYSNLALNNLNTLLGGSPGGTSTITDQINADQSGWYDSSGKFVSPGIYINDWHDPRAISDDVNQNYYNATLLSNSQHGGDIWGDIGDAVGSTSTMMTGIPTGGFGMAKGDGSGMTPVLVPGNTAPVEGAKWYQAGKSVPTPREVTTSPTKGLLQLLSEQNTSQRVADIRDVATLGPLAREAMLQANPDNAELLAKLNGYANQGLDAGNSLTPYEQRALQQSSRGAYAARGMVGSNRAIADEIQQQMAFGDQLLKQREQFAQSMVGENQAVLGDPFYQILGRSSGAVPMAGNFAQTTGPSLFNPESALAGNIASGNKAYQSMFDTSKANTNTSLLGTGVGAGIGALGAILAAI